MEKSEEALTKLRDFIDNTHATYLVTKGGRAKKKLSLRTRDEAACTYVAFVNDLVTTYVRPMQAGERADVTQIYAPPGILKELDELLSAIGPMLIFYSLTSLKHLQGFEDEQAIIFADDAITTKRQ